MAIETCTSSTSRWCKWGPTEPVSLSCAWCDHVGRRARIWVPCDPRMANITPRPFINSIVQQAPVSINLRSLPPCRCSSTIHHHRHRSCCLPTSFGSDNGPIFIKIHLRSNLPELIHLTSLSSIDSSDYFIVPHHLLWRAEVHALPMAPSTPTQDCCPLVQYRD